MIPKSGNRFRETIMLAGLLVDGEHRDIAFAAAEHHLAVHILHSRTGRLGQA